MLSSLTLVLYVQCVYIINQYKTVATNDFNMLYNMEEGDIILCVWCLILACIVLPPFKDFYEQSGWNVALTMAQEIMGISNLFPCFVAVVFSVYIYKMFLWIPLEGSFMLFLFIWLLKMPINGNVAVYAIYVIFIVFI